jgi:hypothetical protein
MELVHNDRQRPLLLSLRQMLALILFVTLCSAVAELSSSGFLPGSGPRFVTGKVTHWERGPMSDCAIGPKIALAVGGFALTADFHRAFVRFDRNQNRRLWPVVASDLTRSPPASFIS